MFDLKRGDKGIFGMSKKREDWTAHFPQLLGDYVPGDVLFPQLFNEITNALSQLDDTDCLTYLNHACAPVSIEIAATNFSQIVSTIEDALPIKNLVSLRENTTIFQNWTHGYWLLLLNSTVVLCIEKLVPFLSQFQKESYPLIRAVGSDISSRFFSDLRDAIIHWNVYMEEEKLVFYFRPRIASRKTYKNFYRKTTVTMPEMWAIYYMTKWLCITVIIALLEEKKKREIKLKDEK